VTTHFNGQFTIDFDGDTATGKGNCLAHHLLETETDRSLIIVSIRYEDQYAKSDGAWYFAERHLIMDWTDTRPSQPYPRLNPRHRPFLHRDIACPVRIPHGRWSPDC